MYNLVEKYKWQKEYKDENKEIKNKLTEFVDDYFLTYNKNQLRLMKIIYDTLNPIMRKYNTKLVFKGGNVMRLINNNVKKYLPPNNEKIIMNVFEPFLKQSDDDFTVYFNPNINNYEYNFKKLSYEIFIALDRIKKKILDDLPYYFDIFNLDDEKVLELFGKLKKELNAKSVKIHPRKDQEIILSNPKNPRSDVLIYENVYSLNSFIYNNINLSLEFGEKNNITKFNLIRSKINFLINYKKNVSGELIDISLPHKKDNSMHLLTNTEKYNKYIRDNIVTLHNKEYDFEYNIINLNYVVHDLFRILYVQNKNPWDASKYGKRVARLIYFIFVNNLNGIRSFSVKTFARIKNEFMDFLEFIKSPIANPTLHIKILNSIIRGNYLLKKGKEYDNYMNLLTYYSNVIIQIINDLTDYITGKDKLNKNVVYELDIV